MAKSTASLLASSSSDANFRAWIAGIITGITGVGWVQTSDTGQIDTTTVTVGASTNVERGYAMFRSNDGLPNMYCRIGFLAGNPVAAPKLNVAFGAATDGAGNLTGLTVVNFSAFAQPNIAQQSLAQNCYFSGTTSRFVMALWTEAAPTAATTGPILFGCERSRDAAGADTSTGFFCFCGTGSTTSGGMRSWFMAFTGQTSGVEGTLHGPYTTNSTTVVGTTVGLFPTYPIFATPQNPSTQLVSYKSGDITPETVFSFTLYGATATFLALRNINGNTGNVGMRPAIRWET